MYFYHKDSFIQEKNSISCQDRSFLFGDGFFTTFKLEQGKVLFLDKHLERLNQTAIKLSVRWHLSLDELKELLQKLYQLNESRGDTFRVRVMVSRGGGIWGDIRPLKPELFIFFSPWQKPVEEKSLIISENMIDDLSLWSTLKTTSRLSYVQALNEARQFGADDALLLNLNGQVVCSSSANVWMVDAHDRLLTPSNGLKGVTQSALMNCFAGKVDLQAITPEMLNTAKLIFLSNSMLGMQKAFLLNHSNANNQSLFDALEHQFIEYCQQFKQIINF